MNTGAAVNQANAFKPKNACVATGLTSDTYCNSQGNAVAVESTARCHTYNLISLSFELNIMQHE